MTEQKKGSYRYFMDLGDRLEVVEPKTQYVDEVSMQFFEFLHILTLVTRASSVKHKRKTLSTAWNSALLPKGQTMKSLASGQFQGEARYEKYKRYNLSPSFLSMQVFYTSEEVRSFRTLGLKPGIKLLGFKDESEFAIEDNIKHAYFIYPDESTYSGSKRTFTALLKAVKKKGKIGLVRALFRSNSTPIFCAMCPQVR